MNTEQFEAEQADYCYYGVVDEAVIQRVGQNACPICSNQYALSQKVVKLRNCNCMFHKDCLKAWVATVRLYTLTIKNQGCFSCGKQIALQNPPQENHCNSNTQNNGGNNTGSQSQSNNNNGQANVQQGASNSFTPRIISIPKCELPGGKGKLGKKGMSNVILINRDL